MQVEANVEVGCRIQLPMQWQTQRAAPCAKVWLVLS